ncbi:DUF1858 domain-containing protein [Maricaulis sp. CAU 1757]
MSGGLEAMIVGELMTRWPDTVPVFIRHRMACPGCIMAPFITVREAAHEYGLDTEAFVAELGRVVGRAVH